MAASYLYIPINPGSKRPVLEWGGWPLDVEHPNICRSDEVENSDHDWWATVGTVKRDLLVIDIDLYKMSESQKEAVDHGWFGLLDQTKIVRTPSGGLHVYLRTNAEFEDLPEAVEHVDLKGNVGRGYVLTHPPDEYEVQRESEIPKISKEQLVELPVFKDTVPRKEKTRDSVDPVVSEEDLRRNTAPPCLEYALDQNTTEAKAFLNAIQYDKSESISVYTVLNPGEYPEETNQAAPRWLHDTPSDTGTNFRVDLGGDTFRCWRHDTTGNAIHLIGVKLGMITCGEWDYNDVNVGAIKTKARKEGIITDSNDWQKCSTVKEAGLCPGCGRLSPVDGLFIS